MLFNFLKKLGFFCSSFFFIFFICEGWARIPQADLQGNPVNNRVQISKTTPPPNIDLKDQLSQVLSIMAEVHESIKQNQYKQFQTQISNIISLLDQINVFRESQLTYHQRNYLVRQLYTIKENLRFVMSGRDFQSQHMQMLRKVNKELVHISQMYSLHNQLPQQYSVYFCLQTDSAWIQKSNSKVYNPFQEGYRNCGRKIR